MPEWLAFPMNAWMARVPTPLTSFDTQNRAKLKIPPASRDTGSAWFRCPEHTSQSRCLLQPFMIGAGFYRVARPHVPPLPLQIQS